MIARRARPLWHARWGETARACVMNLSDPFAFAPLHPGARSESSKAVRGLLWVFPILQRRMGAGEDPHWLLHAAFFGVAQLWGPDADPRVAVSILDAWEP